MSRVLKTLNIILAIVLATSVMSEASRCRKKALVQGTNAQAEWWKDIPGAVDVMKLDSSNFDENLTGRRVLVMFFAQWCGQSKRARTTFAALATQIKRQQSSILVGAVDCDESSEICDRYHEIDGYPTIMYIKYRQPFGAFHGPRTQENIYRWFLSQLRKSHV